MDQLPVDLQHIVWIYKHHLDMKPSLDKIKREFKDTQWLLCDGLEQDGNGDVCEPDFYIPYWFIGCFLQSWSPTFSGRTDGRLFT